MLDEFHDKSIQVYLLYFSKINMNQLIALRFFWMVGSNAN